MLVKDASVELWTSLKDDSNIISVGCDEVMKRLFIYAKEHRAYVIEFEGFPVVTRITEIPEWVTLNERTVEWNEEQTDHLRKQLG